MEKTRKRLGRTERHARRLARRSLREAGPLADLSRATGRAVGTLGHDITDRMHPDLVRAYRILLNLNGHPGVNGRPFAECVTEAVELSDIVVAEDATLLARGLHLLDREDQLEALENAAAKSGVGYAEALRAEASAQMELAAIIDELTYRGIDLLGVHRAKAVA